MLRTRVWVGLLLAVVAGCVLFVDQLLHPWYPFLFLTLLGLNVVACQELLGLLPPERRPSAWVCLPALVAVLLANWPAQILDYFLPNLVLDPVWRLAVDPWHYMVGTFTAVVLSAFLKEVADFRVPGEAVSRIALTVWLVAYLGLLPSFLIQLRWAPIHLGPTKDSAYSWTMALAMAVFVPKCGDIGAYLVGRVLGRTRMTPALSPKKTWEGFAGGLAGAVLAAMLLFCGGLAIRQASWTDLGLGVAVSVGFGLTVGLAAVWGDLAESLIKREGRQKDASDAVPGFGGILDVVDSVIFAAPVAFAWLRFPPILHLLTGPQS